MCWCWCFLQARAAGNVELADACGARALAIRDYLGSVLGASAAAARSQEVEAAVTQQIREAADAAIASAAPAATQTAAQTATQAATAGLAAAAAAAPSTPPRSRALACPPGVDPAVFAELPEEVQRELCDQMSPSPAKASASPAIATSPSRVSPPPRAASSSPSRPHGGSDGGSGSSGGSDGGSGSSGGSDGGAEGWEKTIENEQLAHELLMDPAFQLESLPEPAPFAPPTPADLDPRSIEAGLRSAQAAGLGPEEVRARVAATMKAMFWSRLVASLTPTTQVTAADFKVGSSVQARFGGPQGAFFAATVTAVHASDRGPTFDIVYAQDGVVERGCLASQFRLASEPADARPLVALVGEVRARLEAATPRRMDLHAK